ncbi:MAG: hypothetical protein U0324_32140 [Polyangiales bacterium]
MRLHAFTVRVRPSSVVRPWSVIVVGARPPAAAALAAPAAPAPTTPAAPRSSVNPTAAAANEGAAVAPPWGEHPDAATLAATRARVAHVALPDALRAHFVAQITDAAAEKLGRKVRPQTILHDLADDLPRLVDAVLAGRVAGFGPAALRYTLDLAGELAARWEVKVRARQEQAEAKSRRSLSEDAVHTCLTALVRRTRDVLPATTGEREALDAAAKRGGRTLDAGLEAVEQTLVAVGRAFERAAKDPAYAAFLADANYTPAAVAAIVAPVEPALRARRDHGDAQELGAQMKREIDVLEGRLRDQLLRLRARVTEARKGDRALPEVKAARLLSRPRTKKAAPAGEPKPAKAPRAPKGDAEGASAKTPAAPTPAEPSPPALPPKG